jgi:hypothetical protein
MADQSKISTIQDNLCFTDVVVPINTTFSNMVNLYGTRLVGIITPSALTSTSIGFQAASTAAGTPVAVYNSSGIIAVTVATAAARYIALNPNDYACINNIRISTGSTELAARTFTLVTRPE